jgi:hypothetical protein
MARHFAQNLGVSISARRLRRLVSTLSPSGFACQQFSNACIRGKLKC